MDRDLISARARTRIQRAAMSTIP